MKYDGNEPFIFGDKAFSDFNEIKALNTEAKFNALDLYELKKKILERSFNILWNR